MSDIFNEVDEELRRDHVENLFRRYLPHMIAVAVIIVAGVGGREVWNWYKQQRDAREANVYAAASELLDKGQNDAALKAFEKIAKSGPSGYVELAKLQAADAALKTGDKARALEFYDQAARNFDDPLFKDLADIKSVMINYKSLDFEELAAQLNDAVQAGRPYRSIAREIIATKALQAGKTARARSEYESLVQSLDTPPGVLQRAQIALSLMGPAPKPAEPAQTSATNKADTAAKPQADDKPADTAQQKDKTQ